MTRLRVALLGLLLLLSTVPLAGQTSPAPAPGELAWERLMTGNRAFVTGTGFSFDDIAARRATTAKKQSPRVSVVACADSRVAPELLFHQTLGDLFTIRTAGNVVDDFAIASLEYAAVHEWTDLIVVLGHSSCGAITAALHPDDPETPALRALVDRLRESFLEIPYAAEPSAELVRTGSEANARHVASFISAHSATLRERIRKGKVQVIPAYVDLSSGIVTRLR